MKNITLILLTTILTFLNMKGYGQDPMANVQVIHNAPDETLQKIDIYVKKPNLGYSKVVNDLDFRNATNVLRLPLGSKGLSIAIAPDNSNSVNDTVASFSFQLQPDDNYVAVAQGILPLNSSDYDSYKPLDLSIVNTRQKSPVRSTTTILTHHGSPGAGSISIEETKQQQASALVKDLAFGDFSNDEVLPTQDYELAIISSDSKEVLGRFSAPLDSLGYQDSAITLFTSGFINPDKNPNGTEIRPGFGLYTALPSGRVEKLSSIRNAKVQFINNIADTGVNEIDIFINGNRKVSNLSFREATAFTSLPPNQAIDFALAKAGDPLSDTLKAFSLSVKPNTNYIAVANGIVSKNGYRPYKPLQLSIFKGARLKAEQGGNTDVLFHNGATDLPTINIVETVFGEARKLASGLSYPEFTDNYKELNAGDYIIEIQQTIDGSEVRTFNANFYKRGLLDSAILAFTSGFRNPDNNSNGSSLTLSLAYPNGNVVKLENVTGIRDLYKRIDFEIYPNPVNEKLRLSFGQNDMSQLRVEVMTINGQQVKTQKQLDENNASLDLAGLASGTYLIRILANGRTASVKTFVKE